MTLQQGLSFAVIVAMMAAFVWGRYRYDVVAVMALLVALAVGVVTPDRAFAGFSDDIVIIVGSALVVSAGVARSGIMELLIQRYFPKISTVRIQLVVLVTIVTVLSAFVKNIGALAIMIPIAFQFAKRSNVSASVFLMPMAFGSLLGGLMTQIGTSPNIIVSRLRAELGSEPFTMFDFTPVGASLALVGIVFLAFGYRLLPVRKRETASIHEAIDIKNYVAEAKVTAKSPLCGKTVADLLNAAEGGAQIASILRKRPSRVFNRLKEVRVTPLPDAVLLEGDIVVLEGDPEALDRLIAQEDLSVTGSRNVQLGTAGAEVGAIEAVVGENSPLIGLSAKQIELFQRFNVNLLAVSRKGGKINQRLGTVSFRIGDVIVLQGERDALPGVLRELGCLPLAERPILLGSVRRGLVPLGILIAAMGATATGTIPVAIAFFAAAVAMVVLQVVPVREVYRSVDGPILVMLAALIPVSESLRETGATDLIAAGLVQLGQLLPAWGALGLVIVAAMAVTPFLNNAATVLVMAPIAASYSAGLGFRPDAFLMAVAIGAGCDFLTPIGHQCNTLVMGPGGYRFSDYPKLGLPLSVIVVLVAVPLLMVVWPLN